MCLSNWISRVRMAGLLYLFIGFLGGCSRPHRGMIDHPPAKFEPDRAQPDRGAEESHPSEWRKKNPRRYA